MANNCGVCLFFQGPNQRCIANRNPVSITLAPPSCFKAPASFFSGRVCGGCRFFQGPNQRCIGNFSPVSITIAPPSCYSPTPG